MKLSSICSIILGGIIGIAGVVSFIVDIFAVIDFTKIIIDTIAMIMGFMTMWQGLTNTMYECMVSKKLSAEWDYKMEPYLKLLTDTAGRVNTLELNVLETNAKVSHTIDYMMQTQKIDGGTNIIPGASFKFIIKAMMLLVFTFSALVYVAEYPFGIVHYFITVIYILWWALITSEYKLWNKTAAWIIGIMPVLIIPTLGILLDSVIGLNNMMGILFLGMFAYAYLYYTWASYITTGFQLIDFKPIQELLKRSK